MILEYMNKDQLSTRIKVNYKTKTVQIENRVAAIS